MNNTNSIPQKYGKLISEDLKIYRDYFIEMCTLLGINVTVKTPMNDNKQYTLNGDLDIVYNEPITTCCIFEEAVDQKTLRKLGWATELEQEATVIYLPYDLENIQKGTLVTIPSAIDGAKDRTFRVSEMSTIMIYPASIACKLEPEWENTLDDSQVKNFTNTNFNLLREPKEFDWSIYEKR